MKTCKTTKASAGVSRRRARQGRSALALLGASALLAQPAFADSVAQVATAKRISRQTVKLIDPQGRPTVDSGSSNVLPFEGLLDGAVEFEVASGAPWWDLDAPIFWAVSRNPTGRLRLKLIGTAK